MNKSSTQTFSIGFIGLGFIGGSIAKSIKRIFPNYHMIGFDVDEKALAQALQENILNETVTDVTKMKACDYIFLCAPVHYNITYLSVLKNVIKPSCIITDVGSVKNDICQAISEIGLDEHFIGGHPMVGSERSGYTASTDRLIENAYYFITPSAKVDKHAIEDFRTFIEDLDAIPIVYSPEKHDEVTAYISHIPHVIASGLVNLVAKHDTDNGIHKELAAGGFKDITRIASSSPLIWEHILLSNSNSIIKGLEEFANQLQQMIQAIQANDAQAIYNYFDAAKNYRNLIPNAATGVLGMNYDLYLDVPDERGVLAVVAGILANASINLKNIGILHNREDNEGVLKLSFYNQEDVKTACIVLTEKGYKIYER